MFLLSGIANGNPQSQVSTNSTEELDKSVLRKLPHWTFTTQAYEQEALGRMIDEANRVARELRLQEKLPITKSNLTESIISPPTLAMFATISTSNYTYYASVGKKFSGVEVKNPVESFYEAKNAYTWPISRLNTNKAFELATQVMAAAGMDVAALNRDFMTKVTTSIPEEMGGRYFVPIYWVSWRKAGEVTAVVEIVEPTKSVRKLRVFDAKYILRKRLSVPNLAVLLSQTNVWAKPNEPAKLP